MLHMKDPFQKYFWRKSKVSWKVLHFSSQRGNGFKKRREEPAGLSDFKKNSTHCCIGTGNTSITETKRASAFTRWNCSFVLDHDNDLEFRWAFHPEGRRGPCRSQPGTLLPPLPRLTVLQALLGENQKGQVSAVNSISKGSYNNDLSVFNCPIWNSGITRQSQRNHLGHQ